MWKQVLALISCLKLIGFKTSKYIELNLQHTDKEVFNVETRGGPTQLY